LPTGVHREAATAFFFTFLAFSTLVSAQELHIFSNGEVADAEKINENFEALKAEISEGGGCSAEQDGSSVVITCADGSTGVLASAGTIVLLPSGQIGEIPDVTTLPAGDFVWVDGAGNLLGGFEAGPFEFEKEGELVKYGNVDVYGLRAQVRFYDYISDESVVISSMEREVSFPSDDCSGTGFISNNEWLLKFSDADWRIGSNRVPGEDPNQVSFVAKSVRTTMHVRSGVEVELSPCIQVEQVKTNQYPVVTFTPPSEWTSPKSPVSILQLAE
jgi:hypothetical protein